MARKRKTSKISAFIICITAIVLFLLYGSSNNFLSEFHNIIENTANNLTLDKSNNTPVLEASAADSKLLMYTVDTGNSDCIILITPDKQSLLIDSGEPDDFSNISHTLKELGVEKLDIAIATHPDADHIGSMSEIIENFTPTQFYLPPYESNTQIYDNMVSQLNEYNISTKLITAPFDFSLGDVSFYVVNPQNKTYTSSNESSIVLVATYGDTKILLTGDAENTAMEDVLALYPELLDVDILKVGHHGSSDSTSEELLNATTPEIAIITSGEDNPYGHPHKETLDLLNSEGVITLRTDVDGDIMIISDGTSFSYETAA